MLRIVIAASLPALLASACAHLPPLAPVDGDNAESASRRCRQAFPPQPWHATHTIVASLPFGMNGGLIGATAAEGGALHAILLSPEGMTLFDGTQRGTAPIAIARALPPFDRGDFAASLMADVGNTFLAPAGRPTVGRYSNGALVCRWSPPGGETTDVELAADGPRTLRTFYGPRLSREVFLVGNPDAGFYPLVVLRVPGTGGYRLDLRLIEHE